MTGASDRFAVAVCACLALGVPHVASAQPAPELTSADRETARNLMDVGHHKYKTGQYAEALKAFEGADEIMGVTSTGLWVGKALVKVGRLIEARDKLIAVQRIPREPNEPNVLSVARDEADKLQLEVADMIPELAITITGLHDGADVTLRIDGEEVDREALVLPRKVDPGDHLIQATSPGYGDLEVRIAIAESEQERVALAFVKRGESIVQVAPPPDDGGSVNLPMWISFGVAGAAAIVGGITGGVSLSKASAAREGCDGDDCLVGQGDREAKDLSVTLAHVSTASFVVAGAAAVAGIVFLILDDDAPPSDAHVTPLLGPAFVGVHARF